MLFWLIWSTVHNTWRPRPTEKCASSIGSHGNHTAPKFKPDGIREERDLILVSQDRMLTHPKIPFWSCHDSGALGIIKECAFDYKLNWLDLCLFCFDKNFKVKALPITGEASHSNVDILEEWFLIRRSEDIRKDSRTFIQGIETGSSCLTRGEIKPPQVKNPSIHK